MNAENLNNLSKIVSHALRHEPWLYELQLDKEGWVSIEMLLESLRFHNEEWKDLNESYLIRMIDLSGKKRHEIKESKIRALYGHTVPQNFERNPIAPPEILYHGTAKENLSSIIKEGLNPMKRQFVHLSTKINIAREVALRKSKNIAILEINAKEASEEGVSFYKGNELVWLVGSVLPKYICEMK